MSDDYRFLADLDLIILRLKKAWPHRENIADILVEADKMFVSLSADQKVIALNYLLGVITSGGGR